MVLLTSPGEIQHGLQHSTRKSSNESNQFQPVEDFVGKPGNIRPARLTTRPDYARFNHAGRQGMGNIYADKAQISQKSNAIPPTNIFKRVPHMPINSVIQLAQNLVAWSNGPSTTKRTCLSDSQLRNNMVLLKNRQKLTSSIIKKPVFTELGSVGVMEYFGAFTHVLELDFYEKFEYPFSGDIREFIENLKNNENPAIAPLNTYNYSFLSNCSKKCENVDNEKLRVVFIVKSAMANFDKRMAIRHSWGFEKRFSDVPIRTVFVLGVHESNKKLQFMVQDEQRKFGDIVQANFIDTYYNNTIKTLMGFNWAMKYCTNSRFYMFADDDMYISTKNVLRFLRNPTQYPKYLETPVIALPVHRSKQLKKFVKYNVYSYRYVIASHGFSDPDELLRIWNEQRSAGNA
uniref:Hexosyltransferase n=1 Tax=Timema cristinae TaxID=61476 RepID=A0A7R9GZZ3_TIMCR|nr:unnamed protein product [Timema cristinae]